MRATRAAGASWTARSLAFRIREIDHGQVGAALAERVGDHAPVAAGRLRFEAEERGRRGVLELLREVVERVRRMLFDVRAVGGRGLLDAAGVKQPAQVRGRPELAPVLVDDAVIAQ